MIKHQIIQRSGLRRNTSTEGDSIEIKMRKILANKEPIKDGAPLVYTERKDGVHPSYNVRTDRFEVAIEGHDKITKSRQARRDSAAKEKDGKPEPTQGDEKGKDPLNTDKS